MNKTNNSLSDGFFLLSTSEQEGQHGERPHIGQHYSSAELEQMRLPLRDSVQLTHKVSNEEGKRFF